MLRLFRYGVLIGLLALAIESLQLAHSAHEFTQTALESLDHSFNR